MPTELLVAAPHQQNAQLDGVLRIRRLADAACADHPPLLGALLQIASFAASSELLQLRLIERTGCSPAAARSMLERAQQHGLLCQALHLSHTRDPQPANSSAHWLELPQVENAALLNPEHDLLLLGPAPRCDEPESVLSQLGLIREYPSPGVPPASIARTRAEPWCAWLGNSAPSTSLALADVQARRDYLAGRCWPPQWLGIQWMTDSPGQGAWTATGAEHWQGWGLLDNRRLLPPTHPYFASAYGAILAALFPAHYLLQVPAALETGQNPPQAAPTPLAELAIHSLEAPYPAGEVELAYRVLVRHLLALGESADQTLRTALSGCHYRRQLAEDRWREVYALDLPEQSEADPPACSATQLNELRAAARDYAAQLAPWPQRWRRAWGQAEFAA